MCLNRIICSDFTYFRSTESISLNLVMEFYPVEVKCLRSQGPVARASLMTMVSCEEMVINKEKQNL